MRRGAPQSSQMKKPAVMADVDDLEGGGSGYGGGVVSGGSKASVSSGNAVGMADPSPLYSGYGASTGNGGGVGAFAVAEAVGPGGVSGLYDSGKSSKRRQYHRHSYQSILTGTAGAMSGSTLTKIVSVLLTVIVVGGLVMPLQIRIFWLVYGAVVLGGVVSLWLCRNVLSCDDGTKEMRAVVSEMSHVHIFYCLCF